MLQGGAEAPVKADDAVRETTTQSFVKDVIEASKTQPVLVDFWAPWCGPCRQLTPVIEKAVRAAKGKVKLAKMNIDEHPGIPGQLGIQSIPAVIAFVNGRPVDGFMGALPEAQVKAFIERITKSGSAGGADEEDLVAVGEAGLADGDVATAADIFAQALAEDPENTAALAGLARCYIKTGSVEQARQTLALVPEGKRREAAVAAAFAALELAEQAADLGPLAELEARVAANAGDHQARFDLALALNADGRRDAALDQLLAIVRADRGWNEEAARKQLVQFFEAWGPTDPVTIAGRKRLSSILFA